jgi:hypothetical protein
MFVVTLGLGYFPEKWRGVMLVSRVARWFVFKPKIQILINFAKFFKGRYKYVDIYIYFTVLCYIL